MRGDGRREDQLRAPTYALLKALGKIVGRDVVVHDEVTLSKLSSRPDFAVDVAGGRLGYIELKAPEKGIPENWRPTKHDREQWQKLRDLPNLIYTNGKSWALYRKGILQGTVANLSGDLARAGDKLAPADHRLEHLFREFLAWRPERPRSLRGVVSEVAPLCRLMRDQVAETMTYEATSIAKRPFTTLAQEWRDILFPTLSDAAFADAYAQTVTFALLLARVDGIVFDDRSLNDIAEQLGKQHSLIGEALSILANPRWVRQLSVVEMIRRVIAYIDWNDVRLDEADAYTMLYETFLAEYDPKLRRKSGTYYTPDPVARAMVSFADKILKSRLGKARGFASDEVVVVDPAMGTGTFLVEIIDSVATTLQLERGTNAVPKSHLRELFARRLVGFELQVAPYAVAEMRLHHTLKSRYRVDLPREEVRFLSNTLDDPDTLALNFGQLYEVLKESRDGANRVKRETPVMVVVGNPPWRERARGDAPWIEAPRDRRRLTVDYRLRPSLDEFRASGQGKRAFNLSNMWTFFWRWATWKVFDANPLEPAGIVALITPSAYLSSDSHAGMRRYLRQTADEGWIIDVTPEGFQPDVPTRLFPGVQQPICIGVFARYGAPNHKSPARVHHLAVSGNQSEKFEQLLQLTPQGESWREAPDAWEAPFQPADAVWTSYLRLADLFPWQHTGVNSNRNWVWAPDAETLRRRWSTLINATGGSKAKYFKETRDRSVSMKISSIPGVPSGKCSIEDEDKPEPELVSVAFRSFDRQYLIYDRRMIDFPRPELWQTQGPRQVYMFEQHAHPFADGPALAFSALVPNVHCFNGRGGRVLPLYRDANGLEPNIAPKLLESLSLLLGVPVAAADLLAYVAAVVAHPAYTARFREELRTPGIRVPITIEPALWQEAVETGREVLWLWTFGERYVDATTARQHTTPRLPDGQRPLFVESIPSSEEHMPDKIAYSLSTKTIIVGEDTLFGTAGRIERVEPAVWEYTVGGMPIIRKWFSYRQRNPRLKKHTSELDNINPTWWTRQFDDELYSLLNVLGRCVALEPRQADLLGRVCAGPLISIADLVREGIFPIPDASQRPPRLQPQPGSTL
jgi:hypothetical protein